MSEFVLIKQLSGNHAGALEIVTLAENPTMPTDSIVTAWQKSTTHYRLTGQLPGVKFQRHRGDMVSALVAVSKL